MKTCLSCNTELSKYQTKYCNAICQQKFQNLAKVKNWLEKETKVGMKVMRRFVIDRDGFKCKICGINEWMNSPIVLEMEHIDGNSENNKPENLCLICPNCHSQTPTYKAKNKGNGRHSRRERYNRGKSY